MKPLFKRTGVSQISHLMQPLETSEEHVGIIAPQNCISTNYILVAI